MRSHVRDEGIYRMRDHDEGYLTWHCMKTILDPFVKTTNRPNRWNCIGEQQTVEEPYE